ncbi:MAG: fumarylacetoacetate hydrolase family protein [Conexibacteraceae bacterium]|nr:fumarylacetoacetate hydrolase family protein [Conexibacteraceae bacterium]
MIRDDGGTTGVTLRGRRIYGPTEPAHWVRCSRETPLSAVEVSEVVEIISTGRITGSSAHLPERLRTRDWDSVRRVELELDRRLGWPSAGWKVGAASDEVRQAEGLPGPIPGRLYQGRVFKGPALIPGDLFINYRNVECELAFHLAEGFAARSEPYTETEVAARIRDLVPALEIGDMVFEDWYGSSGYFGSCLDNGGGGVLVYGEPVAAWRSLNLPEAELRLYVNGSFVKSGAGQAAMGHPLTSLTWLVNWVCGNGLPIAAGEVISTGTCTGHCFVAPGDEVTLDVPGIGAVSASFA